MPTAMVINPQRSFIVEDIFISQSSTANLDIDEEDFRRAIEQITLPRLVNELNIEVKMQHARNQNILKVK
jgi:hypothetical protein